MSLFRVVSCKIVARLVEITCGERALSCTAAKMDVKGARSRIAVAQMTSSSDKIINFDVCRRLTEEARDGNAQMIFFPEACDYMAEMNSESMGMAEDLDGPLFQQYRELAKEFNIWMSIGGFHNKTGDKMYNTHVIISSDGSIAGKYNKIHLFDVEIPDKKIKLKESDFVQKGESLTEPIETPIGKIGMGICYDLRFPEFSMSLARLGAQILTFPSAFTIPTGLAHWQSLLRARAIETQCYVVAAAQTGLHNSKRSSYGHAMVVDPWGTIVSECQEGTSLAMATIDLDYLNKIRTEMPVMSHHRRHLYESSLASKKVHFTQQTDQQSYTFGQVTVPGCMIFYQTRYSMAFVNKRCVVPGHVLVIPKRVALRLPDLLADEVADLFITVQKVQSGMERFHQVTSSTVTVQDGPDAGQTIQHVHVHVLPRRPGDFQRNDDVYDALQAHDKQPTTSQQWRSPEEMANEAAQLRQHFAQL